MQTLSQAEREMEGFDDETIMNLSRELSHEGSLVLRCLVVAYGTIVYLFFRRTYGVRYRVRVPKGTSHGKGPSVHHILGQ